MTYKESINLFRLQMKNECAMRKIPVPKMDDREIMIMMSAVQSDIQSTHRVTMETKQVGYVSGEKTYNLSADLSALVE